MKESVFNLKKLINWRKAVVFDNANVPSVNEKNKTS